MIDSTPGRLIFVKIKTFEIKEPEPQHSRDNDSGISNIEEFGDKGTSRSRLINNNDIW